MPIESSIHRLARVVVRGRTLIVLAVADVLLFMVADIANGPGNQHGFRLVVSNVVWGVDVAVIPQPEVHVIPHRTPECNLVDGDSLRSATGGEETVELSRQVVGRGPTELCGDDDGLVAAA